MLKNLICVFIVSILLISSVTVAFADTGTKEVANSDKATLENVKLDVQVVSDSEVHFTVTNADNVTEAVATKDKQTVTTKYYCDNQLMLTDKRALKDAQNLGNKFKSNYTMINNPMTETNSTITSDSKAEVISMATTSSIPSTDVKFDGLAYTPKSTFVPYKHPDKSYYGISPYSTYSKNGTSYKHVQINCYDSNAILQSPAWAIGGGVGALVGGVIFKNLSASVVGAIIGGALGAYFGAQSNRLADENGCIWFTLDNNPGYVNLGTMLSPAWYTVIHYVDLGPFSKTNFYY